MKTYIFTLLVLIGFFVPSYSFASFFGAYTPMINIGTMDFMKIHGQGNMLYVYEDIYINPFNGSSITQKNVSTTTINRNRTTVSTVSTYFINGVAFNSTNGLYLNTNAYLPGGWKTDADGVKTIIQVLGNTYTNVVATSKVVRYTTTTVSAYSVPNQNVLVRKYYNIPFNYDTTPPVAGNVYLYSDPGLTIPYAYTGAWTNADIYYTMMCADPETGCTCVVGSLSCKYATIPISGQSSVTGIMTPADVLRNRVLPTASFQNTVNLPEIPTMITGLPGGTANNSFTQLIHYDRTTPIVDIGYTSGEQFDIASEANRIYQKDGGGNFMNGIDVLGKVFFSGKPITDKDKKASNNFIDITLTDNYNGVASNGVSGIQNYSIDIKTTTGAIVYTTGATFPAYNPNGTLTTNDIKNITLTDSNVLKKSGHYILTVHTTDFANNETQATVKFNTYPAEFNPALSTLTLDTSVGSSFSKYADDSSTYRYILNLSDIFGNPIYEKQITALNQDCGTIIGCKTIKTDMVTVPISGEDALIESGYTGVSSNANGKIIFSIKSNTPGIFSERFTFVLPQWDDSYNNIVGQTLNNIINNSGPGNSFRKPFTGTLQTSGDNGATWIGSPTIGTMFKYKLYPTPTSSISLTTITSYGYHIEDFATAVQGNSPGLVAEGTVIDTPTLSDTNGSIFSSRINAVTAVANIGACSLKIQFPTIGYILGGQKIRYFLTKNEAGDDMTPVSVDGGTFLGVRIIGATQLAGKSTLTNQAANFSDISTSSLRTSIRKNAYTQIQSMTNGQVLGGIKYVTGDVSLSGDQSFETLVVKDGNVILIGDLNPSNKKLLIVVIKDNYDVNKDFRNKGNIYIKPNVGKINGFLYADGGLMSVDSDGALYTTDSPTRTSVLKDQLIMNGSLFTRNTVGGAIVAGNNYILPGGSKIQDFNNAMIYDLNYIRRKSNGCDKNRNGICTDFGEYIEPFIIKYDARIQTDPPKLLTN